jgi:hypothetical protein
MVSKKIKIIVYTGMNIGVFIWAAAYCLESASFRRGITVLVSPGGWPTQSPGFSFPHQTRGAPLLCAAKGGIE